MKTMAMCVALTGGLAIGLMQAATIAVEPIERDVIRLERDGEHGPVRRRFEAVTLENAYLRIVAVPGLGERIVSVTDKTTGRQLFADGPIPYTGSVLSKGHMGRNPGGIHVNYPNYHGGSGFNNAMLYSVTTHTDGTVSATMALTQYPHLQRTVMTVSLAPGEAAFRTHYRFENLAPYQMGFNPWINAAFPSRADVQFILPTYHVAEHWFGINDKAAEQGRFFHLEPWPVNRAGVDASFLRNAAPSISVFAYGIEAGYMGIYYHDDNAGLARVFDPGEMQAAKAFGSWQGGKGLAFCELWGAVSHNMEDPQWIGAYETREATELWFPIHGIGGMTWADETAAVNLAVGDDGQVVVGIYPVRDYGRCAIRVTVDGGSLVEETVDLDPSRPFFRSIPLPHATSDEVRLTVLAADGRRILSRQVFLSPRPRPAFALPEEPWHRRTPLTIARWQEAFTPTMDWGPWYDPVKSYEELVEADPDGIEARLGLARALVKDGGPNVFRYGRGQPDPAKLERARTILQDLSDADRPVPRAVFWLGLVHMLMGEMDAATATLAVVDDSPSERAAASLLQGILALGRDAPEASVAHARAAVALMPDGTLARHLLALGLLRLGDVEGTRRTLEPALAWNPADAGTVELLRRAALDAGDAESEIRWADELARFARVATRQHAAGLAGLQALDSGRLPDPHAIDTLTGPALPGTKAVESQ